MNKNLNITVTLTPDDVKTACAEFVKRNVEGTEFVDKYDVKLNVSERTVGYGIQEHSEVNFDSAVVTVKTKEPIPHKTNADYV